MIEFIPNPNLPDFKVASVICASKDEDILNYFIGVDIRVITCKENLKVDPSIKSHTDIIALHTGGNNIIIDAEQIQLKEELEKSGMNVTLTEKSVSGSYPDDVKLNFAVMGNNIIGCFRYADESVTENFINHNKINVKQGYAKCSVLIVSENAAITDDLSIYRSLSENGFDCLLITKGDVLLQGHEYGFIGGASGKISKDKILFVGDITKHRDFEEIERFICKHGCRYVCTDSKALRDIGGFITLCQSES